jgi:7-cyano-7-deazaguanine synthase
VLLSGGIDSATCLYLTKRRGFVNRAITIRFYKIAAGELAAATRIAKEAKVKEHRFVSVPALRELSDMQSPPTLTGLPQTYIPMKNPVYYGLAAAYAEEVGAIRIVGGHNADDTKLFEDTSDEFFRNLQRTLISASGRLKASRMRVWRPLREMTKAEVVSLAAKLGVPLEMTWSCHNEGIEHCWECEGCRQRGLAFKAAGVSDPLKTK